MNSLVTLSSSCLVCVGLCVCVFASCRVSVDVRETSRWACTSWIDQTIRCHGIRNKTWINNSSLPVRIVMDRVLCETKVNCVCVCWKSCSSMFVSVVCSWRTTRCGRVDGRLAQCGFLRWSTKRRSVDFCVGQRSAARHKVRTDVFLVHSYWS